MLDQRPDTPNEEDLKFLRPQITDTFPVTDFLHNHRAHLERLGESRRPEILTVNGTASVVVQSAEAYEQVLELAERELLRMQIRQGLEEARRGELIDGDLVIGELREIADSEVDREGGQE